MSSEQANNQNNNASHIVSPKRSQKKRSQLVNVQSSLNLSFSNKNSQARETFKDTPDIVCLSHLRWNSEFVVAAEQAMQEDTPASEWLSRVDTFLEQISWDRTWASMMKLIDSAIAARSEEKK